MALLTNQADRAQTVRSGWIVAVPTVFVRVVTCPDNVTTAVPYTVNMTSTESVMVKTAA